MMDHNVVLVNLSGVSSFAYESNMGESPLSAIVPGLQVQPGTVGGWWLSKNGTQSHLKIENLDIIVEQNRVPS